jgi:hypothetical protein
MRPLLTRLSFSACATSVLKSSRQYENKLDELDAEAGEGRLTSTSLSDQLMLLKDRQSKAEAQLRHAHGLADRTEAIELDPIAWFDGLLARMPLLQPEWPW